MDDLLRHLKPKHTIPRLWIERVWIYAEINPMRTIREIQLRPGINVVWAREPETQGTPDRAVYGHGVGKTSFCRLLRYCLGENSFGSPEHEERVRALFPNGGVAASVHLLDKTWIVLRPFGTHRRSHAIQGSSPEPLLQCKADEHTYEKFHERIASVLLEDITPTILPGSGTPIGWSHILAWCTRDQEAHLSDFTLWRANEGASSSAGFRRPAQDPINLVKAALGLLGAEESRLLNEQTRLEKELESQRRQVSELEQEPWYWHRELQDRLKRRLRLNETLPVRADGLFGASLETALQEHLTQLQEQEQRRQEELEGIDRELEQIYVERQLVASEAQSLESLTRFLSGETTQIEAEIDRPRQVREELRNKRGICEWGWVDYQQCQHIRNRLDIPNLRDSQDLQEARQRLAEKVGEVKSLHSRLTEEQNKLTQLKADIAEKERERRELEVRVATSRVERKSLQEDLERLLEYDDVVAGRKGHSALESARIRVQELTAATTRTTEKLVFQAEHRSERERYLEDLWNACIRSVVGIDAQGQFNLADGRHPFRLVSHGGQAIQVLEVLLGDWVCLLYSVAGQGHLPGFLVHDCPREADMSAGLYRRFLEALPEWQEQMTLRGGTQDGIPFQYIVTTTSPPPECLRGPDFLRVELHPESEEGLLFGTRLISQMAL